MLAPLGLATGALACQGAAWEPSPVGPIDDRLEDPVATDTFNLFDDLVGDPTGPSAPEAPPIAVAGEPRSLWLWFADGGAPPGRSVCSATPPKFSCSWGGGGDGCAKGVMPYLDRWYADFNIVFTLTKPTSGMYYTEVITSSGAAWCGAPSGALGVAPATCSDMGGNTCYTFSCGSAQVCAQTIAQEHAHLVGLMHTMSRKDILYPSAPCSTCDQFDNADNSVVGGSCRATQNSYQMMHDRLGAWPGGPKPGPFGASGCTEKDPPTVTITDPTDGASVAADFSVKATAMDDCAVKSAHIEVTPQGLTADSMGGGPFQWDLTGLSGKQTIKVTVTDSSDKTTSASINVTAPGGGGGGGGGSGSGGNGGASGNGGSHGSTNVGGGCAAASRLAAWPAAAPAGMALLLVARRRRRSGALSRR